MTTSTDTPQIIEAQGEPLTPLDTFWLAAARDAAKESIKAMEGAAKQLIAITSIAQTVYFAAVSFSNIQKALDLFTAASQWMIVISLGLPLVCWLAGLMFAFLVFKPKAYDTNLESPDIARETYLEIVAYKHRQLRRAHLMLVAGFIPLIINLFFYLASVPVK
jgi:hypothetical protein